MPHKIFKSKSKQPPKRKTSRKLVPTEERFVILYDYIRRDSDLDIARSLRRERSIVLKTIKAAKRRAERDGRALRDIRNVYETPRK